MSIVCGNDIFFHFLHIRYFDLQAIISPVNDVWIGLNKKAETFMIYRSLAMKEPLPFGRDILVLWGSELS